MHKLILVLFLSTVFLLSPSALADDDSDDGPVVIVEYVSLDLPADDDLKGFRMMAGWTFKPGFQLGANLTYYSLDRPSVDGVRQTQACPVPSGRPYALAPEPYMLEPDFTYWGFGPLVGWDLELVEDWFGLEFMVTPTLPITNDSAGWSVEVGTFAYLSLEGITDNWIDLALMGGIKFGHYDQECDCYEFVENRMMPGVGAMVQF